MILTIKEITEIKVFARKAVIDIYESIQDELSEMMEGDSAKQVSQKMGEGWVFMLKEMLEVARESGEKI
jgi:hypothetical protein